MTARVARLDLGNHQFDDWFSKTHFAFDVQDVCSAFLGERFPTEVSIHIALIYRRIGEQWLWGSLDGNSIVEPNR